MTTSEIRPNADDLELLQQLVEWHDSAHLAGHRDAEFLVAFGNDEADVTHPGFAGSKRMSVRTLRRLIRLGALDVLSGDPGPESNAFTFDVVDGVRDRLDELRGIAGLPSAIAAAEARAMTAEERYENQSRQTMELARDAALRREVFAARVGTWVKRLTTTVLLVAFLTATGLTYLATGVPVVPAVAILVLIGIAVADWAFGLDGQFVSHWLEKKARSRVKHWLEQFAVSDPGASVDDERTER